MTIIIPKKGERAEWIRPFDVDGNLERYATPDAPKPDPIQPVVTNAQILTGFVYVPSINLYVGKNRILQNKNWNECKNELHSHGSRMPTIPEFREFVKYLKANPKGVQNADSQEVSTILDEILTVRNPWRAEWLDARFEDTKKGMYLNYYGFNSKGQISEFREQLETYLEKDTTPRIDLDSWLNDSTKQGLPKNKCKKGDLYYWYPRDGCVARFCAGSGRAGLYCFRDPTGSVPALGVRAIRHESP